MFKNEEDFRWVIAAGDLKAKLFVSVLYGG